MMRPRRGLRAVRSQYSEWIERKTRPTFSGWTARPWPVPQCCAVKAYGREVPVPDSRELAPVLTDRATGDNCERPRDNRYRGSSPGAVLGEWLGRFCPSSIS